MNNYFFLIEFLSNFSHINVLIYYVYKVINTLIFKNPKLNQICGINFIRKLYSESKMGYTKRFLNNES